MHRVFEVVTDEWHPYTGEHILSEDQIRIALSSHKTIKEWAYVLHDKDVYSKEDEDKQRKALKESFSDHGALYHKTLDEFLDFYGAKEPEKIEEFTQIYHEQYENINTEDEYIAAYLTHIAGSHKNNHWHIVMRFDRAQDVQTIATWFGVGTSFVELPKGKGAFLDKVEYITHEHPKQQEQGKYLYPDDEIKANFDFRAALTERAENKAKYGVSELSRKQKMMHHILVDGWTLRKCEEDDRITYMSLSHSKMNELRLDYLMKQPPVPLRITIYVDGDSGLGKSSFCRAIAETLFQDSEHPYFSIGNDERVTFDGYDGEPCIIWNDFRAVDFITRFTSQGAYKILDSHPEKEAQQAKHTRVILNNSVNIINGIQPYEEFISGLAGTYNDRHGIHHEAENETQAWRRVPMILCIREDDFDILLNQGFVNNDLFAVKQMVLYNNVRGSMKNVMERLGGEAKAIAVGTMTQPVVDAVHYIEDKHDNKITNPAEMPDEFKHYGESIPLEERKAKYEKYLDELHKEYENYIKNKELEYESKRLPFESKFYSFDWWLEKVKHINLKNMIY